MVAAGKCKDEIALVLCGRTKPAIDKKITNLGLVMQCRPNIDFSAYSTLMGEPLGEI
jgi:hypothetical protein